MILLYILAACSFFAVFVLFLVLSKTLNNIMNNLVKLHYLLQKELDFKKEQLAIGKLIEEETAKAVAPEEDVEPEQDTPPAAAGGRPKK